MTYDVEYWLFYCLSMSVFSMASYYLVKSYRFERKYWIYGYAYPSPGLLFITSVYMYFFFTGFMLWNFEILGETYRVRFGYGTEYYFLAMMSGFLAMVFAYSGYKKQYFYKEHDTKVLKYIVQAHNSIIYFKGSFWLALLLFMTGLLISYVLKDISSVGYGDGNYAEKISDPRVKIVSMVLNIFSHSLGVMWYFTVIRNNRIYFLTSFIVTILAVAYGMGHASLFGVLGYALPIITIYLYRNLVPENTNPLCRINVRKLAIVIFLLLSFFLINKSVMRSLSNLGLEVSIIDLILNIDVVIDNVSSTTTLMLHAAEGFISEISGIDMVSLINVRQLHGVEIEYGSTYLIIFVCLIPSLFYSGKPETTLATWFADKYWFTQEELLKLGEGVQANVFHIIGETFINFGYFGIIFIPLIFYIYGSVIGWLMSRCLRNKMFYLPIYLFLFKIMHEIVLTLSTVATIFSAVVKQMILVSIFVLLFCFIIRIMKSVVKIITN
jgi:hypothetical protein